MSADIQTLHRKRVGYRIGVTVMEIRRHDGAWEITGQIGPSEQWLADVQLTGCRFRTRREAHEAFLAHAAIVSPPILCEPPVLHRRPDGSYVHYQSGTTVRRDDAPHGKRWTVKAPGRVRVTAATLHDARLWIGSSL